MVLRTFGITLEFNNAQSLLLIPFDNHTLIVYDYHTIRIDIANKVSMILEIYIIQCYDPIN